MSEKKSTLINICGLWELKSGAGYRTAQIDARGREALDMVELGGRLLILRRKNPKRTDKDPDASLCFSPREDEEAFKAKLDQKKNSDQGL